MGRPRILPLPDAQATVIMRGLEAIRLQFGQLGAGQTKRPLWEAVVKLVHQATGQTYGHQTYRAILKVYGKAWTGNAEDDGDSEAWKYGPSTPTLQTAIRAVRSRIGTDLTPNAIESLPQQGFVLAAARESAAAQCVQVGDEAREMERFLRMEIEALRSELSMERNQRIDAVARQERAVEEARELSAQLHALQAAYDEQKTIHAQLTTTMERMQAQNDSSHQYAFLQIDRVRGETREKEKEVLVAKEQLLAARKMLENERTLAESYRRQVYELRRRLEQVK